LHPDATQAFICPVCGLQPETIPPLELQEAVHSEQAGDFSLAVNLPKTDILEPGSQHDGTLSSDDEDSGPTIPPLEARVAVTPLPPVHVDGYEILQEVGRGGMGVVYKARQQGLKRLVALKMILSAGHASSSELTRFLIEAEAVARLHHPNIVQIYQVGNQDGRPFLALEFVEGGSLGQRLGGAPIRPTQAIHILIQLAQAMQHAHENGVVHRDLKPANILMGKREGADKFADVSIDGKDSKGSGSGQGIRQKLGVAWRRDKSQKDDHWAATTIPKITDFGLAKRLDSDAGETRSGAIMGTPSYMAPEQAGGKKQDIGPAADIYALGAILYELITGRPPFCGQSPIDTLMLAANEDPVPPSRLQPACPRDLETICLKCLEKEPAKRYASAGDLADDLKRLQNGEPIQARPISPLERALKWARRYPAAAALLLVCILGFIAIIGFGSYYSAEQHMHAVQLKDALDTAERERIAAEEERDNAERAAHEAQIQSELAQRQKRSTRRLLYDAHMSLAQREWQIGHIDRVLELLAEQSTDEQSEFRDFEWDYLDWLCHSEAKVLSGDAWTIRSLAFSPDGNLLVSGPAEDVRTELFQKEPPKLDVRVWNLRTGKPIASFSQHVGFVSSVAFHPNGKLIASAGMEVITDKLGRHSYNHVIFIWDAKTGKTVKTLTGHYGIIHDIEFSRDGKYLASASHDRTARLWDVSDVAHASEVMTFTSEAAFGSVSFDPDSSRLATSGVDGVIRVWDVTPGLKAAGDRLLLTLVGHSRNVTCAVFSPDGKRIASAGGEMDNTVRIWNVDRNDSHIGAELINLRLYPARVNKLSFSRDSKNLAGADDRSMITLWHVQTGNEIGVYRDRSGAINALEFSPTGPLLASGGFDGKIRLWDTSRDQEAMILHGHRNGVQVAFQPHSSRLASASIDQKVALWDTVRGRNLYSWTGHSDAILSLAFDKTGRWLATAGRDANWVVRVWDMKVPNENFNLPESRLAAAFAMAGSNLLPALPWLAAGTDKPKDLQPLLGHSNEITSIAFDPDGKYLASGSKDGSVRIWDFAAGEQVQEPLGHRRDGKGKVFTDEITAIAFSPDGKLLAAAMKNEANRWVIWIWRLHGFAPGSPAPEFLTELPGHSDGDITHLAFTPNSKYLASSSTDKTVRIWSPDSTTPLAVLQGHKDSVNCVAFSPDGRRMATAGSDHTVKLWDVLDLTSPEELLTLGASSKEPVDSVVFSDDGQRLAAGIHDGTIKIWHTGR
jgi:WD40 repeat protein/serine/threonine protein kinase